MRSTTGTFWRAVLVGCFVLAHSSGARAQSPARSTVVIPLKKEKATAKVVTIHDTVTMVRVDTVRIVQTVVRTDTVFRVDTLRDSCSRAALPIPIPIPIPIDHHGESPPATLEPTPTTSVAPEPATFVLVGSGLAAVLGLARYKKRK